MFTSVTYNDYFSARFQSEALMLEVMRREKVVIRNWVSGTKKKLDLRDICSLMGHLLLRKCLLEQNKMLQTIFSKMQLRAARARPVKVKRSIASGKYVKTYRTACATAGGINI